MKDREGTRRLPLEPMLPWIEEQVAVHGNIEAAARALGVSPRRVDDWVKRRSASVTLDVADRALCNADWPQRLYEFWPELAA